MKKYYSLLFLLFTITINAQFNYERSWATYYFGNSTNVGGSVLDSNGNIIIVGTITINETPSYYTPFTTTTAHQPQVAGGTSDVFLAKFSPQGNLLWATYYGGEGADIANGFSKKITLDTNDNIYIVGSTDSVNGIATTGSFISVLPTTSAGFLAKFSPNGVQQWGTYIPGAVASIAIDATDTIYIGGNTNATTNVSTAGAFQETAIYNGGGFVESNGWNFFINKFDTLGNRPLGTYCGKADLSAHELNIALDSEGSVYVSGYVITDPSITYSYASLGCHQATRAGSLDTFLSKFNPELSQRLWSTYYGGSGSDSSYAITTDNTDVYLVGGTLSPNNIATVGSHQSIISGSRDCYLVKFDSNGTRQWGTYYGGDKPDFIYDINIKSGNVYITGTTVSATNIATTGAYQENIIGANITDGFFAQFTTNGVRNWSSYYGGEKSDSIIGILIDNTGTVYLTGNTLSATNIATATALQPNLNTGTATSQYNMFLAKFTYTPLGVSSFSKSNLQIVPNPNNGNFVLQGTSLEQNSTAIICDLQGRVMFTTSIKANQQDINQEFQLENILYSGVYLVKVMSEDFVLETVKVVVK